MKVLQILDVRWDSGIMRYGLNLASALKQRGHEVKVWALPGKAPYLEAEKLGLPVSSCASPAARFLALRRELQREPVDVVNAHSGSGHTLAAALNATLTRKFALVRTRGDARTLRPRPMSGWLWRGTHGFIAANAAIKQRFGELFGSSIPARTVYWGMDWPDPGPPEQESPLRIGIVARLDPVKGHDTLLEAASILKRTLPEAEFMLAGPESEIKAEDLKMQAASMGLERTVHVLGKVGRIQNFYRTCHIGVVTSKGSEAVSRAAVEWMASGRPLVSTPVGCLPELIEDGKTGFLTAAGDAQALAARLAELALSAELRTRMGREARKRYEAHYRADVFVNETVALYKDALRDLPS